MRTTADVLRGARRELAARGLGRDLVADAGDPTCLLGALLHAAGVDPRRDLPVGDPATLALLDATQEVLAGLVRAPDDGRDAYWVLAAWSDTRICADEVLALFDAALADLADQGRAAVAASGSRSLHAAGSTHDSPGAAPSRPSTSTAPGIPTRQPAGNPEVPS